MVSYDPTQGFTQTEKEDRKGTGGGVIRMAALSDNYPDLRLFYYPVQHLQDESITLLTANPP